MYKLLTSELFWWFVLLIFGVVSFIVLISSVVAFIRKIKNKSFNIGSIFLIIKIVYSLVFCFTFLYFFIGLSWKFYKQTLDGITPSIKTNIASSRNASESWFEKYRTYEGICNYSEDFQKIRDTLSVKGSGMKCFSSETAYCAEADLRKTVFEKKPGEWCADSTGYSGPIANCSVDNILCSYAGFSPAPCPSPTPTPTQGFKISTLKNGRYLSKPLQDKYSCYNTPNVAGEIELSNGVFQIPEPIDYCCDWDSEKTHFYFSMDDSPAEGDINGDGIDDAIVLLRQFCGGNGSQVYLAAMINKDGYFENVDTMFLVGPTANINIESGIINVNAWGAYEAIRHIYKIKLIDDKLNILEEKTEPLG